MRQCPGSSKFISVIETIAKIINSHILINSGYDCKFCGGFTRERKSENVVIWTRIITIHHRKCSIRRRSNCASFDASFSFILNMINGSLFHEAKEIERVQNYFQVTVNLKKLCRIVKPAWLSVVIYVLKPLTFSLESCGLDC